MTKIAPALFVAGAAVVGATYYLASVGQKPPDGCSDVIVACDVYSHNSGYSRKRMKALECNSEIVQSARGDSEQQPFEIVGHCVKESKGKPPDEPQNTNFQCVQQPKFGGPESCMRLRKSDGKFLNPGPENAFPINEAVGDGCEPRPCVEIMGIPWKPKK